MTRALRIFSFLLAWVCLNAHVCGIVLCAAAPPEEEVSLSVLDSEIRKMEEEFRRRPSEEMRDALIKTYQVMSGRLVKDNQLNEALHYMERADDLAAGAPAQSQGTNTSVGYVNLGIGELTKGNIYNAQKYFDQAVAKNRSDKERLRTIAILFHNAGVDKYKKNDIPGAQKCFELAVGYDGTIQNTWELLGDLAYQSQQLKEAGKYWEKAAALGKTESLVLKIEKLKREAPVELDLAHYGASHFIIRYKRDNREFQGYQLKQVLEEAHRQISRDFNYFPDTKVAVILYEEAEFRQVFQAPHWSAGLFDGKIRLPAYEEGKVNPTELEKLVFHELTHAFVFELAGQGCPAWLNEGLAQHQEDKIKPIDLGIFKGALRDKKLLAFEQMASGLENIKDAKRVALFYQQAFLITRFIIERYRLYRVVDMLKQIRSGKTFEEALKKATGLSAKQFEQQWLNSISK